MYNLEKSKNNFKNFSVIKTVIIIQFQTFLKKNKKK